jgi:undecaprenyl-phosphate 4-deoxy-4-formamido-L-arabinose transferase
MGSLSIVIPVFNAALNLENLYRQLVSVIEATSDEFELILVDDCSDDASWEIITRLQRADTRVSGIKLSRNYGQHNALLCGIRAARFPTIVTMDDDLQNPPAEIPRLVDKLREGFDVVYGTPNLQQHGWLRNLASSLTKLALRNAMGVETARGVSAFRAFRTRLRQGFEHYDSPYVSIDVLLTWSAARFAVIEVAHAPRSAGVSNYTVGKLIRHAFNLITGFSTLPLQFASMIGFIFTLFGFGILLWVVSKYIVFGTSVPGFTFLASIIAIFSGVQLFALGIFGEYLARIHFRTMTRPAYVVSDSSQAVDAAEAEEGPGQTQGRPSNGVS